MDFATLIEPIRPAPPASLPGASCPQHMVIFCLRSSAKFGHYRCCSRLGLTVWLAIVLVSVCGGGRAHLWGVPLGWRSDQNAKEHSHAHPDVQAQPRAAACTARAVCISRYQCSSEGQDGCSLMDLRHLSDLGFDWNKMCFKEGIAVSSVHKANEAENSGEFSDALTISDIQIH